MCKNLKNNEARPKFTGSYKKKRVAENNHELGYLHQIAELHNYTEVQRGRNVKKEKVLACVLNKICWEDTREGCMG